MIGRKAMVGLSLLCALLFCALAASSALATGTTAVTCVETKGGDFTDAHCGNQVKAGEGKFAHTEIKKEEKTEISLTNAQTMSETKGAQPLLFTGKIGLTQIEFSCNTVQGTGSVTNEEPIEKAMKATGTAIIEAKNCAVTKPAKCIVKEPFTWDTRFETYENGSEMGIRFSPKSGELFGSWGMEGSECALKGKSFTIAGSFNGTVGGTTEGKGATLGFTPASTTGLKWGNEPYTLTGSVTPQMKEGNPITFTT
jgi:hypothetical protein